MKEDWTGKYNPETGEHEMNPETTRKLEGEEAEEIKKRFGLEGDIYEIN